MRMFSETLKKCLPLVIITAGLCALVFLVAQQSLRMGANDPQIQMAEDAASSLNGGASAESVVPSNKVEIADSLAPFMIIFDDSGKILASSASLHGAIPDYPMGVLDYTRQNSQDRVTWQPEAGVRMATVVARYDRGFVMAGRSLREVEKRADQLEQLCGLALLVICAAAFIVVFMGEVLWREKRV
jgi:hypothetical protein